jgi:hypothetical protein
MTHLKVENRFQNFGEIEKCFVIPKPKPIKLKVEQEVIETEIFRPTKKPKKREIEGIIEIDGLMYQNQPFTKTYTWQEAKEYAKNLRLGGYNDWRLPTREELKKLITKERNKGKNGEHYIRKEFVDNLESLSWFWTSTEHSSFFDRLFSIGGAWVVNFNYGDDYWLELSDAHCVLCVR